MSNAYPISTPIDFIFTDSGDTINFFANSQSSSNIVKNFGTQDEGDILVANANNSLLRLAASGTLNQVLSIGTPVAQQFTFQVGAAEDGAGNYDNKYFTFDTIAGSYYVWFNTGVNVDPALVNKTAIPVSVVALDTINTIAASIQSAINAQIGSGGTNEVVVTVLTDTVTITNSDPGSVPLPDNSIAPPPSSTLTIVTEGKSSVQWQTSPSGLGVSTLVSTANGTNPIATGATWVILDSVTNNNITWSATGTNATQIIPGDGRFTATVNGDYDISAAVSFEANNKGTGTIGTTRSTRQVAILLNGATVLTFKTKQAEAFNGNTTDVVIPSFKYSLTAGQYINVAVRHDSNTDLTMQGVDGATYFSVHRVS